MTSWLLVLCCAVALAVFLSWQRKRLAATDEERVERAVSPYHGVSVVPEKLGCSGAQAIRERRYLAREAPRLPLPNCDAATCHCRYSHFDDRRAGERRRINAVQRGLYSGTGNRDHRDKRDRRGARASGFPSDAI